MRFRPVGIVGAQALAVAGVLLVTTRPIAAQPPLPPTGAGMPARAGQDARVAEQGDGVTVRLVDVDVRAAVQAFGRYLDRPILFAATSAGRVSFETPAPVPRANLPRIVQGIVESQGLDFVHDSAAGVYRVQARAGGPGGPPFAGGLAPSAMRVAGAQPGGSELFVVRLRHARAADVAATVNALYGRASALGEGSFAVRGAGQTLGQQLQRESLNVSPQAPATAAPPTAGATGARGGFAGEVTIVPDPGSNALLVRAGRADIELVRAAVRELDVRPLQVLIEVLIAEVRRDKAFELSLSLKTEQTAVTGIGGIRGTTASGTLAPATSLGDVVLRVLKTQGGVNFDATLRAAVAAGVVKILSRPVLIAANNEPAEILVGSQRPFVQISRSLPTDNAARDQVVQYREVGTKLMIKPTISADGYVALGVTQEVSAATAEQQFQAPVISTRSVQTSLLVRDSQTVILGGLSDQQREASRSGVPVLSSIPLLGGLFGRQTRRAAETEFFLFLTPRIIRTDDDAEAVTRPLEKRAEKIDP